MKLNLLDEIIKPHCNDFNEGQRPRPIIIVPAMHIPGNLSIGNAKQFLEGGVYADKESLNGQTYTSVQKTVNGRDVTFDVYDSVTGFSDTRWKRVVAVFVNGHDWQFKDWKSGSDKRQLFARVRAFHICYERSAPPQTIANWNLVKLKVGKHIRHQDLQVFSDFWRDLA